jgi:hypothetical protein
VKVTPEGCMFEITHAGSLRSPTLPLQRRVAPSLRRYRCSARATSARGVAQHRRRRRRGGCCRTGLRRRHGSLTLGHIRGHGCQDLLVYCEPDWLSDHNALVQIRQMSEDKRLMHAPGCMQPVMSRRNTG